MSEYPQLYYAYLIHDKLDRCHHYQVLNLLTILGGFRVPQIYLVRQVVICAPYLIDAVMQTLTPLNRTRQSTLLLQPLLQMDYYAVRE